jgi:MFS family permease
VWRDLGTAGDDERVDTPSRLLTPRFVLVVGAGLAYFVSLGMLLPIVPLYVKHRLGGGDVDVGIAVGALFVGAVVLRPFAGRIGDTTGRRVLIIGGALVVCISEVLYGVGGSLGFLIGARLLTGLGEAAFFVGAATMITDLAPPDRRGEAISYWSVAVYGGLAFGPALGETVLDATDFSTTWLVAAALAAVAAGLACFTREAPRPLAVGGDGATPAPIINRGALGPGAVLFSGLIALAAFTAFVPLYVSEVGLDGADSVFLLYGGLILAVRIIGARLPDILGGRTSGTVALAATTAGMAVIAGWGSAAGLFVGTVLFAAGASLLYPAMLLLALGNSPETERGAVVGTISSFFDLSQGLGSLLVGGVAAATSYRGAFGVGAACAAVGFVALRLESGRRARSVPTALDEAFMVEHPGP